MGGKKSPQDWCLAGMALLRDEGVDALTLEHLCLAVRRTKGSFYHHFPDFNHYLSALLQCWEETLTERFIRDASSDADPAQWEVHIEELVRNMDHRLDLAVRAWGFRDERAREAMQRVDTRRVQFIEEIFQKNGYCDATSLAELKYMAFIGAQQLGFFESPTHADHLAKQMRSALAWLGKQGER